MSLFGGDPSVTFAVNRLQIARMVDLSLRPAPRYGLGSTDDVVNLIGRGEPRLSAQAVGALAQPVVTLEDAQPQLFPRVAVAALVAITALGVSTPASRGLRLVEQLGAEAFELHGFEPVGDDEENSTVVVMSATSLRGSHTINSFFRLKSTPRLTVLYYSLKLVDKIGMYVDRW